jgi:hypothetical protein
MSDMEIYRYLRAEGSTSQLLSLALHLDFGRLAPPPHAAPIAVKRRTLRWSGAFRFNSV